MNMCACVCVLQLTVFDKFGENVSGMDIQYDQCTQRGPVLLVELSSDECHNLINLLVVEFQIFLESLQRMTHTYHPSV